METETETETQRDFEEGEIEDDEAGPLAADDRTPANAVSASDSQSESDSERKGNKQGAAFAERP